MKDYAVQIVKQFVDDRLAKQIVLALMEEGVIKTSDYGRPDIDNIAKLFKLAFKTSKVSSKDRFATKRMIETHGLNTLRAVIVELAKQSGGQYAPSVNSLSQLEEKWVSVTKYLVAQNSQYVD